MISLGVRRVSSNLYLQNRYWLACSEPPLQQTANLQVALERTLRTLTGLQTLMHEKCSQFPGQFLFLHLHFLSHGVSACAARASATPTQTQHSKLAA